MFAFGCFSSAVFAQNDSVPSKVSIKCTAVDATNPNSFLYLLVVNQRTSRGVFGDPYGGFEMEARSNDTILVSARGYKVYTLYLADFPDQNPIVTTIELTKLQIELSQIEVFPEREIEDIERDILNLGAELREMQPLSGASAFNSPVTALYQRFSKIERSKRLVAQMEEDDLKRELLKELFRKYIRYDIIDLSSQEFDDFIAYMNLSTEFIQRASSYELIMAIKLRYEQYRRLHRVAPNNE